MNNLPIDESSFFNDKFSSFFKGTFLGDIALPDVNYQSDWSINTNKSAHQEELEKLKKEVYIDGLQVEEEGLTDVLRKKIKQPLQEDSFKSDDKLLNEAMIVRLCNNKIWTNHLLQQEESRGRNDWGVLSA